MGPRAGHVQYVYIRASHATRSTFSPEIRRDVENEEYGDLNQMEPDIGGSGNAGH